jgi:hypothetical protein
MASPSVAGEPHIVSRCERLLSKQPPVAIHTDACHEEAAVQIKEIVMPPKQMCRHSHCFTYCVLSGRKLPSCYGKGPQKASIAIQWGWVEGVGEVEEVPWLN